MGRKGEEFVFTACPVWLRDWFHHVDSKGTAHTCLYKCLFPVAGWEKVWPCALVDGWWESQKGRLGGQGLCTGFHILLHSRQVLPDKVIACLSQKGPQGSRHPPFTYGVEVLMRTWPVTAHPPPQKGQYFQFGETGNHGCCIPASDVETQGLNLVSCVGALKGLLPLVQLFRGTHAHKIFPSWLPGVKGPLQGEARTQWVLGVPVCYHHSAPGGLPIRKVFLCQKSWTDNGVVGIFLVYLGLENT